MIVGLPETSERTRETSAPWLRNRGCLVRRGGGALARRLLVERAALEGAARLPRRAGRRAQTRGRALGGHGRKAAGGRGRRGRARPAAGAARDSRRSAFARGALARGRSTDAPPSLPGPVPQLPPARRHQ